MANKDIQKKWNDFFKSHLDRGFTERKIKDQLISRGYKSENVDRLFDNFQKQERFKKKIIVSLAVIFFAMLIFAPFVLHRPTITGMPVGLGGDVYYVDAVNGDNSNNGLSAANAFKTLSKLLSVMSDGDAGYLLDGVYNSTTGFTLQDKYLANGMLITAYPGAHPIVTSRIQDFMTTPNSKWTNLSNGLWVADYASAIAADFWVGIYADTNVSLFTHSSLSNLNNSANPEGIFFDNTNDKLYLRLNDVNANPNTISLIISNANVLTLDNIRGMELEVSNLTFECGSKCVYVIYGSNISIKQNTMVGGIKSIDVRVSGNITINQNTIFMIQGPNWSWQDDTKGSLMETTAVWLENDLNGMNVSNNDIYGHFNGIMVSSSATGKFRDIKVHDNYVHDIMDDALEIESYCNGGEFYNNILTDVFVAVSLSPVNSQEKTCVIHNNVLVADKAVRWTHSGTTYTGECFKIIHANPCQYLNVTQNTCVGKGIYTTSSKSNTQNHNNWINNIFYSTNGRFLEKSGLAADGVYYDYNLYYRSDSGALFRYWNSDSDTTEYSTIAAAKASARWDGTWDLNSVQANPQFQNPSGGDYSLQDGSPACTMSSTASYVGAIPCESGAPSLFCGDATCNNGENCSTCASDCGNCSLANNVPTHVAPILNASDKPINGSDATLHCYNQSTYDADNDSVTNNYRWFRNGNLMGSISSNVVDAVETSVGEYWLCEVQPYDGKGYGLAKNSTSIRIRSVCNNDVCELGENCSTCSGDCGACPSNDAISSCTLSDKSWSEDTRLAYAYNLSTCFIDPLNTTLTYNVSGNVSINISFGFNGSVNLSAPANWNGIEYITFGARSGNRSAQSNVVALYVTAVADCGDAICESGESCSNCVSDCGVCPAPSSGGGGGGGGGGASSPPGKTDSNTTNTTNTSKSGKSDLGGSSGKKDKTNIQGQALNTDSLSGISDEEPKLVPNIEEPKVVPSEISASVSGNVLGFLKKNVLAIIIFVGIIISGLAVESRIKFYFPKRKTRDSAKSSGSVLSVNNVKNIEGNSAANPVSTEGASVKLNAARGTAADAAADMDADMDADMVADTKATAVSDTAAKPENQERQIHERHLEPYVLGCLNFGYSYDAIRKSLKSKGIPDEEIESCFKKMQAKHHAPKTRFQKHAAKKLSADARRKLVSALTSYVKKQRDGGFATDDISQMLLRYGYPKDVVELVMKS
jgi:SOS response regulatory protein OraA/RecX